MRKENKISKKIYRKSADFTSALSIFLLLFMLGIMMLFGGYYSYRFSQSVKEEFAFNVNFFTDTPEEEALMLKQELDSNSFVKSVQYLSKDEAAKIFMEQLGGEDFVEFAGFNPLYPSLQVNLRSNSIGEQEVADFISEVSKNPNVKEVEYNKEVLHGLNTLIYYISLGILAFTALLCFVVIAFIGNTVMRWVFDNRLTIRTMELVGARVWFMISPFLGRALKIGVLGSLCAILALAGLVYVVHREFPIMPNIETFYREYIIIAGALFCLGVLITLTVTYISVRRCIFRTKK